MRPDGSFADIPDEVRRRVAAGERVALLLLDALGLRFLHRHDDHPLLERLEITPLRSQFPSTTTAHVTTVHSGLAVQDHGLYEWNVLEPELNRIICPLRFTLAESKVSGELEGRLDPAALLPGPTLYESLGVPCFVLQPQAIADSVFTRQATRGATVHAFDTPADGMQALAGLMGIVEGPAYALLYWDEIDRAGHEGGPDSPEFHAAARAALDAIHDRLGDLGDVTVLVTADHGQVAVSPERVDYLDELWPELPAMLSHPRPAGSSRDAFLHVRDEHVDTVLAELPARLDDGAGGARVLPATELFDRIGPRLAARLGQVAVLAAPGREVWLRSAPGNERWFRGQHGGLDAAEVETYLAEVRER
ncbi:MAG: alkaline phosphatase family protein [Solirubrobacteraceae bacterium]